MNEAKRELLMKRLEERKRETEEKIKAWEELKNECGDEISEKQKNKMDKQLLKLKRYIEKEEEKLRSKFV